MIRINLLPRRPRRRLPGRQFIEIGLPVAAVVVALILAVLVGGQIRGLETQIAETNRKIDEIQPEVARVLELERQIAVLRAKENLILALLRQQLPAASILNEVRLLIPRDVWLTGFTVPEAQSLGLEGFALNYPAVAQFMDNLAAGQLFRSVDLTVVQLERIGAREVVKFSVTARIVKPQAAGGDRP